MNSDQPEVKAGGVPEAPSGEEEPGRLREELRAAVRAQEQLQAELRAAVRELAETVGRIGATPPDPLDPEYLRVERRLRIVERDLKSVTQQLQSILHSRIWRTLVAAGGVLLGFRRSAPRK